MVYFAIFCLGLILGSYLNSWVWRMRENIRVINGRSMCPHCRRQLTWYENIPVLSYLFLWGKCHTWVINQIREIIFETVPIARDPAAILKERLIATCFWREYPLRYTSCFSYLAPKNKFIANGRNIEES